ncbi:MAG: SIMPL domain-containing protein [Herbiconiux sp.]|nr:SIMPL domain-containing protein [Herbiconiux sp.]
MPHTIITVVGTARLRHDPERARVRIGIGFEGSKRDSVMAATRTAHESLTGSLGTLLDPTAGPVVSWHSEDIRVWGQRPWSQEGTRLPVEFHSAVFVDAEFDDFEALSEWIDVVAIRDGVAVDGIEWLLAEGTDTQLVAEARRGAVQDAVAKAREYATALGLGDVHPVSLADPGLLEGGAGGGDGPQARFAPLMAKAGGAPGGGIELKPDEITVEVSVHARFSAAPESA